MRTITLLLLSILVQPIFAQTFSESTSYSFGGVFGGAVDFADVEGDGDLDVLVTGKIGLNDETETSLYLNNGLGVYDKVGSTIFEGVIFGTIDFSDVDMDGDQDVLITGENNDNEYIAEIYLNDGTGEFFEILDTPFDGVFTSSTVFTDIDNDGDEDVIIAGINNENYGTTKLYTNDGNGVFSELIGTPFLGVVDAAIDVADVDGDGDFDLLVTGTNSPAPVSGPIANLYINNGMGGFSLKNDTPFEPCLAGDIAFADVDGDNDQDVLITGYNSDIIPNVNFSKLYTNDGLGNYTEITGTPFSGVFLSSIAFADIDGDNDQDVLITGRGNSETQATVRVAILYTNDGFGTFTEVTNSPFEQVDFSGIAFGDVDGDEDQDVMLTGMIDDGAGSIDYITKLYINESMTSSMYESQNDIGIKVHPNPVLNEKLNISFTSNKQQSINVSFLDVHGRTLLYFFKQTVIGENNYSIDVTDFPKGIYFLKLDDGQQIGIRKVVVQ